MNSQSAKAVFVLSQYDVYGRAAVGSARMLDVLNNETTRFLKLESVRICPPGDLVAITELANTLLVKSQLQAVLLPDEDRPSDSKVFFASLNRKTMKVVISLPTILVEGRIHTKTATDFNGYLTLEAGIFFPVTNATVRGQSRMGNVLECPVILVNKETVSTISSPPVHD
ncbi:MAG: hypothetical protein ACYC6N_11050 [Pirellulaceae bacterium]